MSSSIVAGNANPVDNNINSLSLDSTPKYNTRRRTSALNEKKSNGEVAVEGGASLPGGEKATSAKDISFSHKMGSLGEKPTDVTQARKGLIGATVTSRRRKIVSKPEKPLWQTIVSVLIKNLVLLCIFLGLGQLAWKLTVRPEINMVSKAVLSDIEGRISEVEAFLKKTTKMMQLQVEVVDRKIENEIGSLKKELSEKIEEKDVLLGKEMKKLETRMSNLDTSLREFRDSAFFSKEDFERFFIDFQRNRNLHGNDNVGLDEFRAFAKEIVEKEIEKHAADGLGLVDYALASGGARVVRHSEPYDIGKGGSWFNVAKSRDGVHGSAHNMLEPSFGEPGQCFPLKGSSGYVEIRLRTGIIPEAITLEHVSKSVAYDRSSAPKDCRVSAWFRAPQDDPTTLTDKMFLLTEFTYDLEKSNAQTIDVTTPHVGVINIVRFDFTSNHGSSSHTCIYRLRVHGREPHSVPMLPTHP